MTAGGAFAYSQARLQARHGGRLQAPQWQALEASRTAAHYFTLARAGTLAPWLDGLDTLVDAHQVERHLRLRWQHHVDELARWQPLAWQAAVRWFGTLTDLQRGGLPPLPQRRGTRQPGDRTAEHTTERTAVRSTEPDAARWLAEWQRRLPPHPGDRALLQQPAEWLLPRLADPQGARPFDAEATRSALLRLFRRHPASAVAVLSQLALDALDVERLRGGLVVRLLFDLPRRPLEA